MASIEDGTEHEMRVVSLMPESAVSVIDTDLEVDIAPSVEAEVAEAAERDRRAREREAARRLEEERAAREAAAMAAAEERRQVSAAARAQASAALGPEPSEDETAVSIMIKLPSGARKMRRFLKEDKLGTLFNFTDTLDLGVDDMQDKSYVLTSAFPRQVFSRPAADDVTTVEAAGLARSRTEALFVELQRHS